VRVQQVLAPDGGPESWTVLDDSCSVVDSVDEFLAHLTVIERSPGTVRSYAFDLRDYFEFLSSHGIDWCTGCLEHLGRFVGWLRLAPADRQMACVTNVLLRCYHWADGDDWHPRIASDCFTSHRGGRERRYLPRY
jgi:integrase/recombinase XerD